MNESKVATPGQIEQRAYELYIGHGGEADHDLEDCLAAERELTASPEQSESNPPRTRKALTASEDGSMNRSFEITACASI